MDFLPRLINLEPRVYRGCTYRELAVLAGAGVGSGLTAALALTAAVGAFGFWLGLVLVWVLVVVWHGAGWLEGQKSQRPPHYTAQRIARWTRRRWVMRAAGPLDVRRTRP